jgi:hypothetical protein
LGYFWLEEAAFTERVVCLEFRRDHTAEQRRQAIAMLSSWLSTIGLLYSYYSEMLSKCTGSATTPLELKPAVPYPLTDGGYVAKDYERPLDTIDDPSRNLNRSPLAGSARRGVGRHDAVVESHPIDIRAVNETDAEDGIWVGGAGTLRAGSCPGTGSSRLSRAREPSSW